MDFENRIKIDENALDVEWLEQPELFLEVSKDLAEAKACVDRAKLSADVVVAEMQLNIRANPKKYDLEKTTETLINAAVITQPEVIKAKQAVIHAQHAAAIMQAAVYAFDQRKRALEYLVTLHGQQYFAGPREPRNLSTERESYNTARRPKATRQRRKRRDK